MAAIASDAEMSTEVQELLRKSMAGDALAQFNLGVCFANGKGVAKDERQAVEWSDFRLY